jgi:D-alanyl-D-alanine carboxypeptidase
MEIESKNRFAKLIFSMLTAIASGATLAFLGIFGFNLAITTITNSPSQTASAIEVKAEKTKNIELTIEEADQDPSFVSRFSRVFIYSSDNGKDIIESAKNSLPKSVNKKITAKAYVVIDLERNAILLEKDSERLLPIASITKIVTAVVSKKLLDQNKYVSVSAKALSTYGNEGWLRLGEKIKANELLYPLLMVSSNDASEVLAQSYIKGRKEFIKEMNNFVNGIGAYRTYFDDPSGLSPKNISTAKDLSIITKWIMTNEPDLFKTTLLKSKTIRAHTWINPTHFLNLTSYVGGKNGYTPEANRTSIALFKLGKSEKIYAIILLGSSNRDSDILDLLEEALR